MVIFGLRISDICVSILKSGIETTVLFLQCDFEMPIPQGRRSGRSESFATVLDDKVTWQSCPLGLFV